MKAMTKSSGGTTATTRERGARVRLQKFLAEAGVASRREGERLIQGERVEVNGRIVTELGTRVDPDLDTIRVDGRKVRAGGQRVYYLLHKPRGMITSAYDPQGRPTVVDHLQGIRERVYPVGRLDWNSEGLLILTNDGHLAQRLTHPANRVPKTYRVKVKGAVPGDALESLRRGLFLEGRRSLPARVTRISSQSNTWLEMTMYEGRKNQIKRMFKRLGHPVLKLRRITIGPISDRSLKPGEWRRLSVEEVRRLQEGS